jgi:hypothetical protein
LAIAFSYHSIDLMVHPGKLNESPSKPAQIRSSLQSHHLSRTKTKQKTPIPLPRQTPERNTDLTFLTRCRFAEHQLGTYDALQGYIYTTITYALKPISLWSKIDLNPKN